MDVGDVPHVMRDLALLRFIDVLPGLGRSAGGVVPQAYVEMSIKELLVEPIAVGVAGGCRSAKYSEARGRRFRRSDDGPRDRPSGRRRDSTQKV